jgi:general stress protein 26
VTQRQGELNVAWSLMQEIKVPMVVTHDGDKDRMRARPMAAHLDPDANAIFFLTDAQAAKDKEIDLSDNVCLVFSDIGKQHHVSLTGRAELSDDMAKIKQLLSSLDSAFWTDENDPSIRCSKSHRQLPNIGTSQAPWRAPSK